MLFIIDKINFDSYDHLNLVILNSAPHYRIRSLCSSLLLQFYESVFERLLRDVHCPGTGAVRGHYSCLTSIFFYFNGVLLGNDAVKFYFLAFFRNMKCAFY